MFKSFFLGGFECTTGYNREGNWIDLIEDTWHIQHADEDYQRLKKVGIHATRDAIRWPLVDLGNGKYDFSHVEPLVKAARKNDIDVVWDLFHYGYPYGVDLLSEEFIERFADYCAACARYLRSRFDSTLWFTPVNEPSYFSWAAGHAGHFAPYLQGCGFDLKVALARAAIHGIDAIRSEIPDARFMHADPVCRVAAADNEPESLEAIRKFNEATVFESLDMIGGLLMPELGGSRSHLDVIGLNYYWNCQWVHGLEGSWLDDDDPRRVRLGEIIKSVWHRYGGDVMISETSHWGEHRSRWVAELADEVETLMTEGIPLRGVCIYPIIGMLDWHEPRRWMPMGLWDIDIEDGMRRVIHEPMLDAMLNAQQRMKIWRAKQSAMTQPSSMHSFEIKRAA